MTFPAVQTKTTTSGTLTSPVSLNLPTGIAANDILLMVVTRTTSGQTLTWPAGWTQLFSATDSAGTFTFAAAWAVATGSEGATISLSASIATAKATRAIAYRISPATTAGGIEAGANASSFSANPPSLTPTWGALDTLWFAVGAFTDNLASVTGYPANYTSDQQLVGGGPSIAMATRQLNAASEDPAFFNVGSTADFAAATIAIKPASVAAQPRPHNPNTMRHLRR